MGKARPAEAAAAQAAARSSDTTPTRKRSAEDAAQDELSNDAPDPIVEDARGVDVEGMAPVADVDAAEPSKEELLPAWLAHPTLISAAVEDGVRLDSVDGLDPPVRAVMQTLGFDMLFPVQAALLPIMAATASVQYGHPGDLCVAAPTGSGKTLAYVLTIVQALQGRVVPRLRALVILPTRELVAQVFEVFRPFCSALGLRAAMATGQTPFAAEQRLLVPEQNVRIPGGSSAVDILIATPGRLMDHLSGTTNFTLQHLRYLVVDEADRLLNQSYQEWLDKVLQAADPPVSIAASSADLPAGIALRYHADRPDDADSLHLPLQKLLFSATLTRNPSKIASLRLVAPRYLTVHSHTAARFTTPATLKEYMVVCDSDGDKPLALVHMMTELQFEATVCFTASVEATHRLFRLIQLMGSVPVAEFSSDLSQAERTQILRAFRAGDVRLLVCSDGMARGLDIDIIANVISYDAPVRIQTYIHRVGRTARAGRSGSAYTLLTSREMHHFKAMLREGRGAVIPRFKLPEGALAPLTERYEAALSQLKDVVHEERLHGNAAPKRAAAPTAQPPPKRAAATPTDPDAAPDPPLVHSQWRDRIRDQLTLQLTL